MSYSSAYNDFRSGSLIDRKSFEKLLGFYTLISETKKMIWKILLFHLLSDMKLVVHLQEIIQ